MKSGIAALLAGATLIAVPTLAAPVGDTGWDVSGPITKGDCHAIKRGAQVDSQLLINKDGHLIVIAGWPRRDLPSGELQGELGIDGGALQSIKLIGVGPIALYMVEDAGLEARLRAAKTLHWRFAWGDFEAEVSGLGDAADAVRRCNNA